jgi:hypothetical protein
MAASTKVFMTTGEITVNIAMTGRTSTGRTTDRDIMLPTNKGNKEQAESITVYTAIPHMAESLKSNMHHRRKIGMSDTSTNYYSSWQSKLNRRH